MSRDNKSVALPRRRMIQSVGLGAISSVVHSSTAKGGNTQSNGKRYLSDVVVWDLSGEEQNLAVKVHRHSDSRKEKVFERNVKVPPRGAKKFEKVFSESGDYSANAEEKDGRFAFSDVSIVSRNVEQYGVVVKIDRKGSLSISALHVDVPTGRAI